MKYMSSKEASEKWGISDHRVRVLCNEGCIEGAMKIGLFPLLQLNLWMHEKEIREIFLD